MNKDQYLLDEVEFQLTKERMKNEILIQALEKIKKCEYFIGMNAKIVSEKALLEVNKI